jgi:outer membrane receptor protein involved in Fe transport
VRDLDGVILVGGPTRLPLVREAVTQYFQREPKTDVDPDQVVAMGAAIHAAALVGEEQETRLLEEGRFEAGVRSELRQISNPYGVQELESGNWINLPEHTNSFLYDENVVAGYLQGSNKFGKISMQLGLRIEYSDIKTFLEQGAIENNRSYFDYFPTLHTTYHFNTFNAWQISYSRRINRPNFRNLNPFSGLSDSRNIRTGNPNLNPEYTDAYESGYVYTPGKTSIYAGVYYRHTNGVVEYISYVDGSGITYTLPQNLAQRSAYGAETNISVDAFKWWTLSGNLNLYRMQTEGTFINNNITTDLASDTHSWDTRLNSRMKFAKSLSFQSTFFYRGQQETTQGLRKPFYVLNTSVSKDVLKGNGTLTFNVQDVLNSRKFRYNNNQPDLISQNEFRWSGRQLRLTFIYRLNQKEKKTERNGNNNEGGGFSEEGF